MRVIDLTEGKTERPWAANAHRLLQEYGPPPFEAILVVNDRNRVSIIFDNIGGSNRPHWHADWDEQWVVLLGELRFNIGGHILEAEQGATVYAPKHNVHLIETVAGPSARLCIATPLALHIAEGWSPAIDEVHGLIDVGGMRP